MKPDIIQKRKFLYCLKVGTKIKTVGEGGATRAPPSQTCRQALLEGLVETGQGGARAQAAGERR